MSLTTQDIQKIAGLARLALTPAEIEQYTRELSVVLEYVATLNEVDTSSVKETCQVTGLENVVRADEAFPVEPALRQNLIQAFPSEVAGLLQVQAVFHGRVLANTATNSDEE